MRRSAASTRNPIGTRSWVVRGQRCHCVESAIRPAPSTAAAAISPQFRSGAGSATRPNATATAMIVNATCPLGDTVAQDRALVVAHLHRDEVTHVNGVPWAGTRLNDGGPLCRRASVVLIRRAALAKGCSERRKESRRRSPHASVAGATLGPNLGFEPFLPQAHQLPVSVRNIRIGTTRARSPGPSSPPRDGSAS